MGIQTHDLMIKNIFQIKKDNNVIFTMSKRKLSDIQGKSIFFKQSASNSNEIVKIFDNKHSMTNMNPEKSFWITDVVDMPKFNNLNIPICNDVNLTIAKDADIPAKLNIDIHNKNILNTITNITKNLINPDYPLMKVRSYLPTIIIMILIC